MFPLLYLISISTYFIQPLFIPLAHEVFGVSMGVSALAFAVFVLLGGLVQIVLSRFLETSPLKIALLILVPLPFSLLIPSDFLAISVLGYSIVVSSISRLLASSIIELRGKGVGSISDSYNFYVLSNIGLIASCLIALFFIEDVPLWLVLLDLSTTLLFIFYCVSLALCRKVEKTQQENRISFFEKGIRDWAILVGIFLLHAGCMAQFGIMPLFFSIFRSDVLDSQVTFNLFQSLLVIGTGFSVSKYGKALPLGILLTLGVLSIIGSNLLYAKLDRGGVVSIIAVASIWGGGIGILAPLCSRIAIERWGVLGSASNILLIRLAMAFSIIIGLCVSQYSPHVGSFQIVGSILPILGMSLIFLGFGGPQIWKKT